METVSGERRAEIVELLREAVDSLVAAVGSGRLGFDYAVKDYVEQSDNELSHALQEYVQALQMGDETERIVSEEEGKRAAEIRRTVLQKLARQFAVPEVTGFVEAVLASQDKQLSIVETLEDQAARLHPARSVA